MRSCLSKSVLTLREATSEARARNKNSLSDDRSSRISSLHSEKRASRPELLAAGLLREQLVTRLVFLQRRHDIHTKHPQIDRWQTAGRNLELHQRPERPRIAMAIHAQRRMGRRNP